MSDFGGSDDGDYDWDEISWSEAEGLGGLDSNELVELLDSFEFTGGQFEFTIETDSGDVVSISVGLEDMYDLYEWLADEGFDFYFAYEDS